MYICMHMLHVCVYMYAGFHFVRAGNCQALDYTGV